jgi:hypothetical protein
LPSTHIYKALSIYLFISWAAAEENIFFELEMWKNWRKNEATKQAMKNASLVKNYLSMWKIQIAKNRIIIKKLMLIKVKQVFLHLMFLFIQFKINVNLKRERFIS